MRTFGLFVAMASVACLYFTDTAVSDPSNKFHWQFDVAHELPQSSHRSLDKYVYQVHCTGIDVRGRQVTSSVGAVPIAPDRLVTVAHYLDDIRSLQSLVLEVDGRNMPVTRHQRDAINDLAILTVTGASLEHVEYRSPRYMESLQTYGPVSAEVKTGPCSDMYLGDYDVHEATVSLLPSESPVQQGDSGGAVFGEDGKLVGIIKARNPEETRVCKFVPIEPFRDRIEGVQSPAMRSQSPQVAATPATYSSGSYCVNGQCYQQPQIAKRRLFRVRR